MKNSITQNYKNSETKNSRIRRDKSFQKSRFSRRKTRVNKLKKFCLKMIKRRIYLFIRKQEKKRNSDSDIIKDLGGGGRKDPILYQVT